MANQIINVIVNSKGAVTVTKQLNQMGESARETTTYLNGLRAVLAGALTFSGVSQIAEIADKFTVLQNRLRLVSTETNNVNESWSKLLTIANDSFSTIQGTVDLYFRVAQAYKAWGESAEKAYEFTDLFQKAAILSGSSLQTTSQAVYQFSQALNKGKLDGDEFRSVLEGLPYVASLIQKELGVTRAELYEMSASGKISLERIKNAFTNAAKTIKADWGNITPTIGMAINILVNSWTDFIGRIQNSTGVFSGVAQIIILVANNFDLLMLALTPVIASLAFLSGRLVLGLVVIGLKDMAAALNIATISQWLFNTAVSANPYVLAAAGIAAVIAALYYFREELGLTGETANTIWEYIKTGLATILDLVLSLSNPVTAVLRLFFTWQEIWDIIKNTVISFGSVIEDVLDYVISAIKSAGSYVSKSFGSVWLDLIDLVNEFKNLINDVTTVIKSNLNAAIEELGPTFSAVYDIIKPALDVILDLTYSIIEGWKLLGTWLSTTFGSIVKDAFDGWIIILRTVVGFIKDIVSGLRTAISLMNRVTGGGGKAPSGAHYGAQFNAGEGFANGGGFKVGGTGVGRDTTPVNFRAERGERVTVETKKQQRANDNTQSANVNVPVNIANILDPALIPSVMRSNAGQRTQINIIKDNRAEIRAILGIS